MASERKPIPPNPPRFEPTEDPANIHVPGLDTSAPVNDQIDQIEQLITIQLQNIDENFSKINHLLANKVLPAVKRYSLNTEPVREAAKFWTSFYEQAAQTRIPTYEDYPSSAQNSEEYASEEEHTPGGPSQRYEASSMARSDESSFMPGQAAYASTPATTHRNRQAESFDSNSESGSSWITPESPLVRLDRELQNFSVEDLESSQASVDPYHESSAGNPMPPSSQKGKQKEPLIRNVLRQAHHTASDSMSGTPHVSPLKPQKTPAKTPIVLRAYNNPYLPANTRPNEWNGLVDLSKPAITPGHRGYTLKTGEYQFDDDSFDGLPDGMSPPKLMSPALPPRSTLELKLGQTPGRDAVGRIKRDLLRDVGKQHIGNMSGRLQFEIGDGTSSSSLSTMPTSPSLQHYKLAPDVSSSVGMDSSLESMMRRVGLQPNENQGPTQPEENSGYEDSLEYDDEEEINDTVNPSPAYIWAQSANENAGSDDSFGSSTSSEASMREEMNRDAVEPEEENMENMNMYDESFEDEQFERARYQQGVVEEETVFGLQPRVRTPVQPGALQLLGEVEEDTTNVGRHIHSGIYDSPTPMGGHM